MNILIINGPNLNLLGTREPDIYKSNTYEDLLNYLNLISKECSISLNVVQTNHEGAIIDYLHNARNEQVDAIIINPGAYTHYSYAIRDAISAINIPTIEVHLTDITKREKWRSISVISDVCIKTFMGKHFESYKEAINYLVKERDQYAK